MTFIRETYNGKGLSRREIFYFDAINEFVFDYNYYKDKENNTQGYDFKSTDNGYLLYMNGRLWIKGYLVDKDVKEYEKN